MLAIINMIIFIIISLIIISIVALIFLYYKRSKEPLEINRPLEINKIPMHDLGNSFSYYFGVYFYCCLTRQPFILDTSTHKNKLIRNLPQTLELLNYDKISRYSYIDISKLLDLNNKGAFWAVSFDNILPVITPIIQYAINYSIEKSKIKTNKYDCVLHFRCSDSPFSKHDQ